MTSMVELDANGRAALARQWLRAVSDPDNPTAFLHNDLPCALSHLREATADSSGSPMLEEATLLVVRALRNAVPLGQPAVQAIVHGGAATSVAEVASRLGAYTERSESSTGEDQAKQVQLLAAACAQLLANLASSGTVGADAVWSACFPYAFLALLRCEQAPGRVYDATAMALYGCCRQRYAYSRQLCGIGAPATGHNTPTAGPASSTDPGTTAAASAAAAARQVWVQLLRGFLEGEVQAGGSSAGGAGAGAGAGPGGGPHAGARLLCSCVALRQGLLEPLLGLLDGEPGPDGGSSTAAAAAGARAGQAVTGTCEAATPRVSGFGRYGPVLLHVLAQELYDMRPGVAVHVGYDSSSTADADSSGSGGGMRQGGQQEGPAAGHAAACGPPQLVQMRHVAGRPLASALLHVARLAEAAARECASAGAGAGAGVSAGQSAPPAEAAGGGSGAGGGAGGVAGEASEGWAPAAAVLEAALEVLKSLTQREDGGRRLEQQQQQGQRGSADEQGEQQQGPDLVQWLLCSSEPSPTAAPGSPMLSPGAVSEAHPDAGPGSGPGPTPGEAAEAGAGAGANVQACTGAGVGRLVMGMLAALRPATAARHKPRRDGSRVTPPPSPFFDTPGGPGAGAGAGGPPGGSDRPTVVLPEQLCGLAKGFPAEAPYDGYRGDLVSVLANGAFRRRAVVSEVLSYGGLELVLAQTNLDDRSPLAREWALWGVRNMCEGNEEVQRRIAGLQLQTAVETPELQQLGLRMELDKGTGRMKVVKTDKAQELLSQGP